MNLGKLVPLGVHDKLEHAKIEKLNFSNVRMGVPYTLESYKEDFSNKLNNLLIGYLVSEL